MMLTAENVQRTMLHCLFTDEEMALYANEQPDIAVEVDGISIAYGFHPERLEQVRADVASMLDQLDDNFKSNGGGGWSFLQACVDRDDHQWGEQSDAEMLFSLGIALNLCNWALPREMWPRLPGGVPYVIIDSDALEAA